MADDAHIARYTDRIARELRFDPALAARVREEILEHLREAATPRAGETRDEAQLRAIRCFGDPQAVADQFRPTVLARGRRRLAALAVMAIAIALIAMKARLAWYQTVQWMVSVEIARVLGPIAVVDAWMFRASVAAGLAAWLLVCCSRSQAPLHQRTFVVLAGVAVACLALSVGADVALTLVRVAHSPVAWRWAPALLSVALELICVAFVLRQLRLLRAVGKG